MSELRSLFSTAVALGVLILLFALLPNTNTLTPPSVTSPAPQNAGPQSATAVAATPTQSPGTEDNTAVPKSAEPRLENLEASAQRLENSVLEPENDVTTGNEALRIEQPYNTPPLSFDVINTEARAALVNIFCTPDGGSLSPISGSGVIIDPRGVILTNAHVAQYVLLSQSPSIDLKCTVRTGSPAVPRYTVSVLYMPGLWVEEHASEIADKRPEGTGEHDWALLRITGTIPSIDTPLPASFPYTTPDTRDAIAFYDDRVLAAGYPAEFVGGIVAQTGLYPVSSVSAIDQLLTFATSSVDLISIGGVIEAQGGSSGGPVLNQWSRLVGIITTTSAGTTTDQRDLRALTLSYINNDIERATGQDLSGYLRADIDTLEETFASKHLRDLLLRYLPHLRH